MKHWNVLLWHTETDADWRITVKAENEHQAYMKARKAGAGSARPGEWKVVSITLGKEHTP